MNKIIHKSQHSLPSLFGIFLQTVHKY